LKTRLVAAPWPLLDKATDRIIREVALLCTEVEQRRARGGR
jgi:hypothetical protein